MKILANNLIISIVIAVVFAVVAALKSKRLYRVKLFFQCFVLVSIISFETINTRLFNGALKLNFLGINSLYQEIQQLNLLASGLLGRAFDFSTMLMLALSSCAVFCSIKVGINAKRFNLQIIGKRCCKYNAAQLAISNYATTQSTSVCREFCRCNQ